MAKTLRFSPDLRLSADAATRQCAFIGRTGLVTTTRQDIGINPAMLELV